ncbi:MAG: pantoate--beta-alanine ligase [Gammaproteobacteria bacterium]|nr:pantoate--beta-alanine ligase [Gammaproteobacteria bacterium]
MQTITSISQLRKLLDNHRMAEQSIGVIPTMGNLHAGHMMLVKAAIQSCSFVISTIFVNPLQFSPNEDITAYPRTLNEDKKKLDIVGCNCLFAPSVEEIYGFDPSKSTVIQVPGISELHCGKSRPGHFEGVATVVSKLFNIIRPDKAFFGLKDYQQYLLIKQLVKDLVFEIEIIGIEIERESDGLAVSSRNAYLTAEEREIAPFLYACLNDVATAILNNDRDYRRLEKEGLQKLQEAGFHPDYFSICHAETLQSANAKDDSIVLLAAVTLGSCRLIDNLRIKIA